MDDCFFKQTTQCNLKSYLITRQIPWLQKFAKCDLSLELLLKEAKVLCCINTFDKDMYHKEKKGLYTFLENFKLSCMERELYVDLHTSLLFLLDV